MDGSLTETDLHTEPAAAGETARVELVAPLAADISTYTLELRPRAVATRQSERLFVDLGRGSEATAGYELSPSVGAIGEAVQVGDFTVTIHSAEFVDSVAETVRPETFGSPPGTDTSSWTSPRPGRATRRVPAGTGASVSVLTTAMVGCGGRQHVHVPRRR